MALCIYKPLLQNLLHPGWKKLCLSEYRVFSLTWLGSMQIYWNKRKRLHKKRVQLPEDWFGTPTWPSFHCFGTPIWPPWRHVKALYSFPWKSDNATQATAVLSYPARRRLLFPLLYVVLFPRAIKEMGDVCMQATPGWSRHYKIPWWQCNPDWAQNMLLFVVLLSSLCREVVHQGPA